MKKIGVITNREKDNDLKYTSVLIAAIEANGGSSVLSYDIGHELGMNTVGYTEDELITMSDVIICLGGDGTFLKAARKVHTQDKPILGINLGHLGFLTEVEKNDIEAAVKKVIHDECTIEKRMMLDTVIWRDGAVIGTDTALNDVVISRGALSRILHLKTYINDVYVDSFPGDGLIISSPTGSTAYSLSAGGPIVEPDIDLIITTPICPHMLYSRSFITTGDRVVKVIVDENYCHGAMVTIDGQAGYEIRGGDIIETKKSSMYVKMLRLNTRNFFNVLRAKIYNRGENVTKNEI